MPLYAWLFGNSLVAISPPPNARGNLVRSFHVDFWTRSFVYLALYQCLSLSLQGVALGHGAEWLIHRARKLTFQTLLRQDIAFYDKTENSVGKLMSVLSLKVVQLAAMSGKRLGVILQTIFQLVSAMCLSLAVGWKLGLVYSAAIPAMFACGQVYFWLYTNFHKSATSRSSDIAAYAREASTAIRTVVALRRENSVCMQHRRMLNEHRVLSLGFTLISSLLLAASNGMIAWAAALGFWYGGNLLSTHEYSMLQFFVCFTAISYVLTELGTITGLGPEVGRTAQAADELKQFFDHVPDIDSRSQDGHDIQALEGRIQFRNVHFTYPSRPERSVLNGLNLTILPGQHVALVGASGCGKSTTIALLEQFYDPSAGSILIDDHELPQLHVISYRKYLALVSQEPILWEGTIRDNVLLGAIGEDNPEEAVVLACQKAQI